MFQTYRTLENTTDPKDKSKLIDIYCDPLFNKCIINEFGVWRDIPNSETIDFENYYHKAVLSTAEKAPWKTLSEPVDAFIRILRQVFSQKK